MGTTYLGGIPTEPDVRRLNEKFPNPTGGDVIMHAEIEAVIGPDEAAGYRRYVDFVSKLYKYEMKDFIDRNIDSPLDLLTPDLAKLVAIGGFRKLAPKVRQYMTDPRTERIYSFQAMYAGLSPYDALAIYAVIAYMDSVAGVFFPRGGTGALVRGMVKLFEDLGGTFKIGSPVTSIDTEGNRVSMLQPLTRPT